MTVDGCGLGVLLADVVEVVLDHGSEAGAVLLGLLDHRGMLTAELARRFVARAWDTCPQPMRALDRDQWVELFRRGGYTADWEPAARPTGLLRVYRGAALAGRDGLAWTTDVEVACGFAARRPGGRVWMVDVEPGRLLAYLDGNGEGQHVVDTAGLEIRPYGGAG